MLVIIRALIYSSLFIGFVIVYVPAQLLPGTGFDRPEIIGAQQVMGMMVGSLGGLTAFWCIAAFSTIGRGTPAPFDPPRRLVIRGPYRYVRNPMYVGAGFALGGAALFFGSWPILAYTGFLFLVTHLLVVLYEEPTLRKTFGEEYEAYCKRLWRWLPRANHA